MVAAEEAVKSGADEIDVVMNLPAMLSGDFGLVRNELASVVHGVRMRAVNGGRGHIIVKGIIETCYLSNKMKKLACKIVEQAGCDFVKTSTGVGPRGATDPGRRAAARVPRRAHRRQGVGRHPHASATSSS